MLGGILIAVLALWVVGLRNLLWQRWFIDAARRAGWTLEARPGWGPRIRVRTPEGARVVLTAALGRPSARVHGDAGRFRVRGADTPEALVAEVRSRLAGGDGGPPAPG